MPWAPGGVHNTCIKVSAGTASIVITPLSCDTNYVLINDADGVTCKACNDLNADNCVNTAAN